MKGIHSRILMYIQVKIEKEYIEEPKEDTSKQEKKVDMFGKKKGKCYI